jgi:hypothetical protein
VNLRSVEIQRSPEADGQVRLIGEVIYDNRFIKPERIWFTVSERYAEYLSETGNPWLACLLPLAVTLGEPLRISRPVDRKLYDNAQALMRIWVGWYPHLHIIPIEADITEAESQNAPARTASFFSGGVDAFHTVLHYDATANPGSHERIDDLIFVWGFDLPIRNRAAFLRVRDSLSGAATELGKEMVFIATNLRDTRCRKADFSYLAHASILSSAALALNGLYSKVLIPSSSTYEYVHPWGSHPKTDPLYSTRRTHFVHYGFAFKRLEKTAYITQSAVAMRSLRVCWVSESGGNCGACNKCSRTKVTLALYGALERCTTFEEKDLDLGQVAKIYSRREIDIIYLRKVQAAAQRMGRLDIADALECSFQLSDRINRSTLFTTLWKIKQWLPRHPLLWRLLRPARKVLKTSVQRITRSSF